MTDYNATVARRLAEVYTSAVIDDGRELADLRLILFSDLHKGRGDRADDFRHCQGTYLAALEHYWRDAFEIFLLGDVEELWENRPGPVIRHYGDVLNQELLFAQSANPGRYVRFVGNHDDQWYDSNQVQQHLGSYLAGQPVLESLRMVVHDQGEALGELMFLHGHQGTPDSERFGHARLRTLRPVVRPGRALRLATHPARLQHPLQHT